MKKLFLILSIATASAFSASAQNNSSGFHFGAGIRAGMPIGDWSDYFSFGVGAEVQGEYMFSEKFSALASAGYVHMLAKEVGGMKGEAMGVVPFLAGVRVYPSSNIFIGARAGYGIMLTDGNGTGAFAYEPQVGYNGEKFQVAIGYNALSKDDVTNGHIGLTAIYKFN